MEQIKFDIPSKILENYQQLAHKHGISLLQLFNLGPIILSKADEIGSTKVGLLDENGIIKEELRLPPKD